MNKDLMYRSLDSIGQTGDRLAKSPPEEPDASIAHVRVCEGSGRQRPGLLGMVGPMYGYVFDSLDEHSEVELVERPKWES